ncbi:MAG: hypothetical protein IIA00_03820 [Proteobacteria bacterium]|nr:hypothetical protein [Pseudomonadota bacterium]
MTLHPRRTACGDGGGRIGVGLVDHRQGPEVVRRVEDREVFGKIILKP